MGSMLRENGQGLIPAQQIHTFAPIIPDFVAQYLEALKYQSPLIVSYVLHGEISRKAHRNSRSMVKGRNLRGRDTSKRRGPAC
jgi:hypothetical protein